MSRRNRAFAGPAVAVAMAAVLAAGLAACGEKTAGAAKKADVPAFQGTTGASGYLAEGWKASDQAAWEQQLRHRAQRQNEYVRAPVKP